MTWKKSPYSDSRKKARRLGKSKTKNKKSFHHRTSCTLQLTFSIDKRRNIFYLFLKAKEQRQYSTYLNILLHFKKLEFCKSTVLWQPTPSRGTTAASIGFNMCFNFFLINYEKFWFFPFFHFIFSLHICAAVLRNKGIYWVEYACTISFNTGAFFLIAHVYPGKYKSSVPNIP